MKHTCQISSCYNLNLDVFCNFYFVCNFPFHCCSYIQSFCNHTVHLLHFSVTSMWFYFVASFAAMCTYFPTGFKTKNKKTTALKDILTSVQHNWKHLSIRKCFNFNSGTLYAVLILFKHRESEQCRTLISNIREVWCYFSSEGSNFLLFALCVALCNMYV